MLEDVHCSPMQNNIYCKCHSITVMAAKISQSWSTWNPGAYKYQTNAENYVANSVKLHLTTFKMF